VHQIGSPYPLPFLPPHLLSSSGLGWNGLVVERHSIRPCELPDMPMTDHIIEYVSQQHVSRGERPDWRGRLRPYSKYPGTSNCFPDGIRPRLRSFTQTDLIVCRLDPKLFKEIAGDLDANPIAQLRAQTDIRDKDLGYIMRLLESAAKSRQSAQLMWVI
jgi:AraC family transcriptional regulator